MFNVLDFIDSRDIREYNRSTVFTPLEQAVIVYNSNNTPMTDKLSALHELLDTYSEEEFMETSIGKFDCRGKWVGAERTNKQIIAGYVTSCEEALKRRYDNKNAVFVAEFWEIGFEEQPQEVIFSTYDLALKYIVDEKKRYSDNDFLKDCMIGASITRKPLDSDERQYHDYFKFDTNLNLYCIFAYEGGDGDLGMESFFVYIPLPFKKGDFVRINGWHFPVHGTSYALVGSDFDKNYFRLGNVNVSEYEASNMYVWLECYTQRNGNWYFDYWDGISPLYLEKCTEDELPDDQVMLTFLRDAYLNTDCLRDLLYIYTALQNHDHSVDFILENRREEIRNRKLNHPQQS